MFYEYHALLDCSHENITLEWIPMPKFVLEHLIFNMNENEIYYTLRK
jgi:hypothetical protein